MKEYNEHVVETLDDAGCIIANKNIIIDNLQARIAELEAENARLKAECDDIKQVQFPRKLEAVAVGWKKRLAAEQEECEFQRNAHKQAEELMLEQSNQLAAEQLNNKLLREALQAMVNSAADINCGLKIADDALSIPASTEELDKYVAEKVKEFKKS